MMFLRNLRYYSKKVPVARTKSTNAAKTIKKHKNPDPDKKKSEETRNNASKNGTKTNAKSGLKLNAPPKLVNVSVLGASVDAGIIASLFLKQHRLVRRLCLFGSSDVKNLAEDLNLIDTNARVYGYSKPTELNQVLSAADIVVLIDTDWKNFDTKKKFHRAVDRIKFFTKKIRRHCPKAFVINCVEPICCTTVLLDILLRKSPLYKMNRLIGSIAPLQSQVNRAAARYLEMNPEVVYVPIVGGPSFGTFVPLLNSMNPNPNLSKVERLKCFQHILKEVNSQDVYEKKKSLCFEGIAIAKQTIKIARALTGQRQEYTSCFIKNRLLQIKSSFVTTVRFGREGVDRIYPVPQMERHEIAEFTKSISSLYRKEKYIETFCERSGLYNKLLPAKKYTSINI